VVPIQESRQDGISVVVEPHRKDLGFNPKYGFSYDLFDLDRLRERMHWWFRSSDHEVQAVAPPGPSMLTIGAENLPSKQSVEHTCAGDNAREYLAPTPILDEKVEIGHDAVAKKPDFVSEQKELRIAFHRLVLRDSRGKEKDFVIDGSDLESIACARSGSE